MRILSGGNLVSVHIHNKYIYNYFAEMHVQFLLKCHAHGHRTMTISDVLSRIRDLGWQKTSEIERHKASSMSEESNCELAKIERTDHVSYNLLSGQHLLKYDLRLVTLHDRIYIFLFYGQTKRFFSHFTRMNDIIHLQQRHDQ